MRIRNLKVLLHGKRFKFRGIIKNYFKRRNCDALNELTKFKKSECSNLKVSTNIQWSESFNLSVSISNNLKTTIEILIVNN